MGNRKSYDLISLDLQGTLTSTAFSDEFWLRVLPEIYAQVSGRRTDEAAQELLAEFKRYGRYDYRYYDARYWLARAGVASEPKVFFERFESQPFFFREWLPLLEALEQEAKLIVVSATTHDFIDIELGAAAQYFSSVYSTLEDFGIAGKPAELFSKIAARHGVSPQRVLHIGDDLEFDVRNPAMAGFSVLHSAPNKPDFAIELLRGENIPEIAVP